jgi:deazaflavin-dependent oxidoreductase (nitroreductase family)
MTSAPFPPWPLPLSSDAFRGLNALVEPLVRAGFGSPCLVPWGAVVLETTGRTSGRTLRVPVLATVVGDLVVVASVRPASHWVKNLAAQPRTHYWMGGRRHAATAVVLPGGRPPAEPAAAAPGSAWLAALLTPWIVLGVSVAILVPGHAEPAGGAAAGS